MFLPQKNDTQAFLPECHQILFLYSYFKSVLEYESYIVLGFYNHFMQKAAPNPITEITGMAAVREHLPNPDKSLINATLFISHYLLHYFLTSL